MGRATITTPFGPVGADGKAILYLVGGAVVLWWLIKGQIKHDLKAGAQAVNPVNPNNIFNKSAETVYAGVTGSQQKPGEDVYDATHNPDGTVKGGAFNPFYWLDKAIL